MRDLLNSAIQKSRETSKFQELPKFPSVLRDISFTVPSSVKASAVDEVLKKSAVKKLKSFKVFDYYPLEGKKSFTYTLEFYDDEKTFKDEEVNKLQDALLNELSKKLNAELRK
jgi:phenylalanyl-tRNA synthetase beta chain